MSRRVHWLCNRLHPNASPGDQRLAALRALLALDTRFKGGNNHPFNHPFPPIATANGGDPCTTPLLAGLAARETKKLFS